MTFLINYSGNRYFPILLLLSVLLPGCTVAPVKAPERTDVPTPLAVGSPVPDKASPQAAGMATVRWTSTVTGGAGARTFTFVVSNGEEERIGGTAWARQGVSPSWEWRPAEAGMYKVKVAVEDAAGNRAESGWSPVYEVAPTLLVVSLSPDKVSPQAGGMATVRWKADAAGGVGGHTFEFRLSHGKEEKMVQGGASAFWDWSPREPGTYRVKAVVRDAIGNRAESTWSPEYAIVPKLLVSSPSPDKVSPQAATMVAVRWKADATGGVGERAFDFRISDGKEEKTVKEGGSAVWDWSPREPGTYRVKAVVRDAIGNRAESAWSPEYKVVPPLTVSSLSSDKVSPQAANTATVRWKIIAGGGIGKYTYAFKSTDGNGERVEQEGPSPTLDWSPKTPGTYRIKAVVRDTVGNTAESGWSPEQVVAPRMVVSLLSPETISQQAAGMATVYWKVDATGGVGEKTFEFRLSSDAKEEMVAQVGPSAVWGWSPREPGRYRVKAVVRDATGYAVDTGWSPEYVVVPKLTLVSLSPDKASPQAAGIATVRWKAEATGGVGEREYMFWSSDGIGERAEQKGLSPTWDWFPREPGRYRVKVEVRDEAGNTVDSGWSPEYRIDLTPGTQSLIAVMPIVNLTGTPIPGHAVGRSLVDTMRGKGFNILGETELERFLEKYRVRYTGGLIGELGEALREETGANVVLFVTLETFEGAVLPKLSLVARLVSTHRKAAILWMDSVAMAGNDAPGFLLLAMIYDPRVLWEKAKDQLLNSLMEYLSGKEPHDIRKTEKKFLPKNYRGVPPKPPAGKETLSVAVLPFRNESTRRNAGEIMALHFIRGLSNWGTVEVVEPGVVRQVLLRSRTIMEGGLSLPQADILHDELNVDLVLTGVVMEYQDSASGRGNPKVEFSTRVFDMQTRQIIWSSSSYNEGDDGVFFFNLGRVNTAHGLASEMVRSVIERLNAVMQRRNGQLAVTVPPGPRP